MWVFGPVAHNTDCFWISVHLKHVKKIIPFRIFKIVWAQSLSMPNDPVCILRISGMNLSVYCEDAKLICTSMENTQNKVNILTEFCHAYSINTRNESVYNTLRIHRMNLVILRIRRKNLNITENKRNARKVIENSLGRFSGA